MREKTIGERNNRLFHRDAQTFANASALFERRLMIALQPALIGIVNPLRQTRPMCQTIQKDELVEPSSLEHLFQIKFDVRRTRKIHRIA